MSRLCFKRNAKERKVSSNPEVDYAQTLSRDLILVPHSATTIKRNLLHGIMFLRAGKPDAGNSRNSVNCVRIIPVLITFRNVCELPAHVQWSERLKRQWISIIVH